MLSRFRRSIFAKYVLSTTYDIYGMNQAPFLIHRVSTLPICFSTGALARISHRRAACVSLPVITRESHATAFPHNQIEKSHRPRGLVCRLHRLILLYQCPVAKLAPFQNFVGNSGRGRETLAAIVAYRHTEQGFVREDCEGLAAVLPLSEIETELPLALSAAGR